MFDCIPTCQQKWIHSMIALQIPKTATSSVSLALKDRNLIHKHRGLLQERFAKHPLYRGVFNVRHAVPSHLAQIFGRKFFDFFSFAVVRHPIERLISSYYFGKQKKLWSVYGLQESTTLDQYISWLYDNKNSQNILILLPQTTWAANKDFPITKVLKFENLAEDWKNMLAEYKIAGLPDSLPHENKSQHKDWREEISAESLKKALDFTQKDRIFYPEFYD